MLAPSYLLGVIPHLPLCDKQVNKITYSKSFLVTERPYSVFEAACREAPKFNTLEFKYFLLWKALKGVSLVIALWVLILKPLCT